MDDYGKPVVIVKVVMPYIYKSSTFNKNGSQAYISKQCPLFYEV